MCEGLDWPIDGSCLYDGCCMEFRGMSAEGIAGWVESCRWFYGDEAWLTGPCPSSYWALGGCHVRSFEEPVEPADPELGAYWTSFHPDMSKEFCAAIGGCWGE